MFSEGFCDAMFESSFDSTSTDFNFSNSPWNNCDYSDGFYAMADSTQVYQTNTWKSIPLISWTSTERLHWMCNEATNNNRNYEEIKLHNFVDIANDAFLDLTSDEFISLSESEEDGQMLFKAKETLIRNNQQLNYAQNRNELQHCHREVLQERPEERPHRVSFSSTDRSIFEKPRRQKLGEKRGPGRPPNPKKRMGKLWEFLQNLLLDDKTCPSLIKWENYQERTFKFVQSEKVAKLWGGRKNNDSMNYEKLSRAMRYYYRSKVLLPVAGKRLVYKFGPASTGWKMENPILEQS